MVVNVEIQARAKELDEGHAPALRLLPGARQAAQELAQLLDEDREQRALDLRVAGGAQM